MINFTATKDDFRRRRSISLSGTIASLLIAVALASGAAVWIALPAHPAFLKDTHTSSFDDRFSVGEGRNLISADIPSRPLARLLFRQLEIELEEAKGRLAQKLQSRDWRAALNDELSPSIVAAVPLPRPRPVAANLDLPRDPSTAQSDNRTLLQRFSDLFPARITLASLAPDGGLLGGTADLTSLGYDNFTAVYDISARAVYMPNGSKLEAHSGLGRLMDDPEHVNERDVGATPPNVYDLKPRERLFHGVQVLRMIPVGDNDTLGRSGLLAHGYMLGPNGDSNGCVSIKNYEKFLSAFKNGEIRRLVVVPSINDSVTAARRPTSQS